MKSNWNYHIIHKIGVHKIDIRDILFHRVPWQRIAEFCKDRSGVLGLSFVVGMVCLWSVACGAGEPQMQLYDSGSGGVESMAGSTTGESTGAAGSAGEHSGGGVTTAAEASASPALSAESSESSESSEPVEPVTSEEILVFVCGEVRREGVYRLRENARVYEAVAAAGGFAEKADTSAVNQVMTLRDGDQLRIPRIADEEETGDWGGVRGDSSVSGTGRSTSSGTGRESGSGTSGTNAITPVNINLATREELMTIPGIGGVRADAILAYRESHGPFASKEDICNVSGIKSGTYAKIEPYIAVE